jgi:energy-coupling factor transporter ATP-binding protein EcfA2
VRIVSIEHFESVEALLPTATIDASLRSDDLFMVEASTADASFMLQWRYNGNHGAVLIRSGTAANADQAEADVKERRPPVPATPESVRLDFWQVDGAGDPYTSSRSIDAPHVDDISANYPADVWHHIERLRGLEPQVNDGRIVLWHGPPGTGKTSAIRALARAWHDRIRVQVLLDPERILASSAMLMSVLLDDAATAWRLLVIEDADELLRADAKERVGQALSRLLNLSDGLLGQGSKVLVLITTNEPIGQLHPALVRPGRCLVESEFRRFSRAEAGRLTTRPLPSGSATFSLAEVCAINDDRSSEVGQEPVFGTYL